MAIFSLHHSVIGKSSQPEPFTAAAHVRYITRRSACRQTYAARLPEEPAKLRSWLRSQENSDRKNGRVCDKLMLAIPRELDTAQRDALVRTYAEAVTQGRASWFLAIHDKGKDARNPHCHLMIRDRDPDTGKRVIHTSERGSTERFREEWELACNTALDQAHRYERISRRSNRARGLSAMPTIHIGPRAQVLHARRQVPASRKMTRINAPTAKRRTREVDYQPLDQGRSRATYQAQIVLQNEQEYWRAIDADKVRREAGARTSALPTASPPFDREAFIRDREARLFRPESARPTGLGGFDRQAFERERNASGRDDVHGIDDD